MENIGKIVNRPPALQFYPDKWQSHTRRLSDVAYRVYHEMICWMWLQSPDFCSIPNDPGAIACILAVPCERIASALLDIQNEHAPLLRVEGDKLVSNGLRKVYENLQERRDKAVASAKARWDKPMRTQCERNANASFEQCSPTPTSSPTPTPTVTTERKRGCKGEYTADFNSFWEAYPKKVGKKAALKAWNAAKDKPDIASIITSIQRQSKCDQWVKDNGQFIPHPATWLNQGRWADVVESRQTTQARPAKAAALISRDSAIRDAVRALTEASATGDISRCMKALNDKYRDIPPQNGQTVAGEALEIWRFRDKQGREGVQNAPQGVV